MDLCRAKFFFFFNYYYFLIQWGTINQCFNPSGLLGRGNENGPFGSKGNTSTYKNTMNDSPIGPESTEHFNVRTLLIVVYTSTVF